MAETLVIRLRAARRRRRRGSSSTPTARARARRTAARSPTRCRSRTAGASCCWCPVPKSPWPNPSCRCVAAPLGAGRTVRARGTSRVGRRGSALRHRPRATVRDRHAGRRRVARPHGPLVRSLPSAGIEPRAAYADSAVVPVAPNGCTLLLDESALYVRRAKAMPYVLDAEPLSTALDLALGAASAAEHARTRDVLRRRPRNTRRIREHIEGLRARTATLQVKLMTEGALPLLAAQSVGTHAVNLLQGPYAQRSTVAGRLQRWRLPAALAAACLLMFLVSQALSLWKLSRAEKHSTRRSPRCFSRCCPASRSSIRARRCRACSARRCGQGRAAARAHLARAGDGARRRRASVEAVNLRGDALDLRVVAPTVEALDGIKQAMARRRRQRRADVGHAAWRRRRRPAAGQAGRRMNYPAWLRLRALAREPGAARAHPGARGRRRRRAGAALPGAGAAAAHHGGDARGARRAEVRRSRLDATGRAAVAAAAATGGGADVADRSRWWCWSIAPRARPGSAPHCATRARTVRQACACVSRPLRSTRVIEWLGGLQQRHGVTIEAANFDATGNPGLVNASLTLGHVAAS